MSTTDKLSSRKQPILVAPDTQVLAEAFCMWPLPSSVCSDPCATDSTYAFPRSGTNLLTVAEAKAMFDHLVDSGLIPVVPPPATNVAEALDALTSAVRALGGNICVVIEVESQLIKRRSLGSRFNVQRLDPEDAEESF